MAHHVDASEVAAHRLTGPQPAPWFAELEHEFDNLREAVRLAVELGDLDGAARMVVALYQFAQNRVMGEPFVWAAELADQLQPQHASFGDVLACAIYGARARGDRG